MLFECRRPTPISPPYVKYADFLRPVVESRRRATESDNRRITASPFSAVFVSSAGPASTTRGPTPIEARASRVAKCESGDSRGLETQSGPHTGLLMTSDVARARPLSPGSGEGQRIPRTPGAWRRRERASHQTRSLPDLWLMIARFVALRAARDGAIVASSVTTVARVRRLARPLPSPLRREELLHREDGPSRQHVKHRASDLVGQNRERLPLPCFFSRPASSRLPSAV